jgi:dipeptidyl aminopeptidase/acylaminoacyl peptidase
MPLLLVGLIWTCTTLGVERRVEGHLQMEGIPPVPQHTRERLDPYRNARSALLTSWLPDGGLLISTRFADSYQLHAVREPMGARTQLTFFTEPVMTAAASPSAPGAPIAYLRDVGGNEDYQIFLLDPSSGRSTMISDGEARHTDLRWSNGGRRLAYSGNARDGRSWDVHLLDLADRKTRRVMNGGGDSGYLSVLDWSGDDSRLLVRDYRSINDGRLYVLDLASGEAIELEAGAPPGGVGVGAFGPRDESVYFISERGAGFLQLRRADLGDGSISVLSAGLPWNLENLDVSDDGVWLAWVYNEDGLSRLSVQSLVADDEVAVTGLPLGRITRMGFEPGGSRLAVTLNGTTSPGDVFVVDPPTGRAERWTASEVGGMDASRFVEPTLIRFSTFDSGSGGPESIPAFVYRPDGEGPHPVLVYIHGGPESQFRPTFRPLFQYFVSELGLAVVAPNVRGSSGYGREFVMLDDGFRREDSVRDIAALLDWIGSRPDLDEDRVILFGSSYGGYMVLASMIHFPDRIVGGVESVGISNFITFLENTRDYRRDRRRLEYGDERDPGMRAFLERISPTNNAHRIDKPLLIVQGLNDPRVPVTESEQMVATIRENGGEVWYLLGTNEGHGFRKKQNRDRYYEIVSTFLESLLQRSSAGAHQRQD